LILHTWEQRVRGDLDPAARSFAVWNGVAAPAEVTTTKLEQQGFRRSPDASLVIILDAPLGFALTTLETVQPRPAYVIVVTCNLCVEYCADLWEQQPDALLAGAHLNLAKTIARVARGEQFRDTPARMSRLTPAERRVLRLLARGWSNRRIAAELSLQYQSVLNVLASIY
jgi:DNA-binding CsgD family transcriptional regulator